MATLVAVTVFGGLAIFLWVGPQVGDLASGGSPGQPKTAAIVDQLSLTFPNPSFVKTATVTLERAGYVVDYYPGDAVTVDLYRSLPAHSYDLIILRVHSGLARDRGQPTGYASLFSGEPYVETKHAQEEAAGLLGRATSYAGGSQYFSIVPAFIESSMTGTFDRTAIVMMGCNSLRTDITAEALVRKGAKAVLGWTGPVSASYTDRATERLLQHLVTQEVPVREAAARTMAEVGPDPSHGSTLVVYPSEG